MDGRRHKGVGSLWGWAGAATAVLVCCCGLAATEDDAPTVPDAIAAKLCLKILSYDNNLTKRAGDAVHIAVVYFSDASYERAKSVCAAFGKFSKVRVKNLPSECAMVRYREDAFGRYLKENKTSVVYVVTADDYTAEQIRRISQTAIEQKAITFTDAPRLAIGELSISFEVVDNKPSILLNIKNTRNEGCDFDARFLKVCRVIREDEEAKSSAEARN